MQAWNACDENGKQNWRNFEDSYNHDLAYQFNWNKQISDIVLKHQPNNDGSFGRNAKFIAFHRDLENANLEPKGLSDRNILKKWEMISMWNKGHAGVTFWDYIEFKKYFNDSTKSSRKLVPAVKAEPSVDAADAEK